MISSGTKRLAANTGALFFLQLANYILPFLLIPFLTRTLGVSLYGVVAFGLAIVQLACIFTDFGFSLSATRQIATCSHDKILVKKIVGAVHVCKLLLLIFVVALMFVFLLVQQQYKSYEVFFWLLLFPIVGQTFQPVWFFQGIERMAFITVFVVIARSLYIVLAMILISKPEDYFFVAVANGSAQIVAAIVAVGFMIRLGYFPVWPGWSFVKVTFVDSMEFFWSRAAVATYTAGGAVYLGLVSSPISVAYYSAAEQLYRGGQALIQPLSQALYPYMAKAKDFNLFFRVLKVAVAFSLAGLFVGFFWGQDVILFMFGAGFESSFYVLSIFMVIFCITVPSVLLGYPFLGALGDTRSANFSVIYAGLVQLIALLILWFFRVGDPVYVVCTVLLVECFVLFYRVLKSRSLYSAVKWGSSEV